MRIETNEDYQSFRNIYLQQPVEVRVEMRKELADCLYKEILLKSRSIVQSKGGKETASSVTGDVWLKFFSADTQDVIEQCDHLKALKGYLFQMVSNRYIDKVKKNKRFRAATSIESSESPEVFAMPDDTRDDSLLMELMEDVNTILKKHLSDEEIYLLMDLLYRDKLKYVEIQPLLEGHPSPDAIGQRIRKLLTKLGEIEELRVIYENMER